MKKIVSVSFGVRERTKAEVRRILTAAGHEDAEHPDFPLYGFDFEAPAPELEELRAVLAEIGVTWSEQIDHLYTDKEIEQATLVLPILRRADQGVGGPSEGTEYDLADACPKCWVGARQLGPLKLKGYEIRSKKGKAFPTAHGEWLFAEDAASQLSGFTGLELRQAVDVASGHPLPWFQAIAEHELPPMAPGTAGIKGFGCLRCRRGRYFHKGDEPPLLVYDGADIDVEKVPDVSHTFEHFGYSHVVEPLKQSWFMQPQLLLKPAVAKAMREAKVRQLQFYPVTIR